MILFVITFQNMQTYWCLASTGRLAGVISSVTELRIINGKKTQGSSPVTIINWTQHLSDNMNSSIRVKKPGVMDVPVKLKMFCCPIKILKGFNDASFDGNEGKSFPFFCNQSCKIWFARSGRVPPQNRGHSQPHWWKHFIGHSFEDLCLGIPMIALLQPTSARGKLWWNQKWLSK